MKKGWLFYVALVISFPALFGFCVSAQNNDLNSTIEHSFFGNLDSDISGILNDFEIDSLDGEKIFATGTENIKKYFSLTLKDKLSAASGWFFMQLSIIMLLSVFSGAFEFSLNSDALTIITAVVVSLGTIGRINDFLSCVVSAMSLNGRFMLAFIPVFALLVSLAGNPSSALTYNSFVLFFCEILSFFIDKIFVGLIGAYFAVSIAFFFNPSSEINRFTAAVNKISSVVLGFTASVFTGLLSLKNILAYSTDSLSVKGVKFLLGSLVPVIGPSLSEAYSSVLGSINLMKSSLAVLGIFLLVIVNIPPMTEGVIYFLLISVLGSFAEMTGLKRASEIYRCFSGCVKMLLLICLFQVFILVISTGIMLTVKGGVSG